VPPVVVLNLFQAGYLGLISRLAPNYVPIREAQVRQYFRHWHVGTVVFYPAGADPALVLRYLTFALGRTPVKVGGVDVWYHTDTVDAWLPAGSGRS
jgi:hypothetical protein